MNCKAKYELTNNEKKNPGIVSQDKISCCFDFPTLHINHVKLATSVP